MEQLSSRFEQKRGHFMILERTPPLTRNELNDTQIQMLKQCEVPGLLRLETEESDGCISLRYSLSGTRMLSEAMRTTQWSMAEMIGALCKVADVLEECRLYLLDSDRIRLQDEFIFVGEDWHDLKFTYLPIDMPTLRRADDLERLVMRWMMKIKDPDGQVLQNILRLVATENFMPIILSRYAKHYLSGQLSDAPLASYRNTPPSLSELAATESTRQSSKAARSSWDLLQPASGDLHSISELLGDAQEHLAGTMHSPPERLVAESNVDRIPMDMGRWRIVVACVALFLVAIPWRFVYLNEPNENKLLICLSLTLITGAGFLMLWKGKPRWWAKKRELTARSEEKKSGHFLSVLDEEQFYSDEQLVAPRFPAFHSLAASDGKGEEIERHYREAPDHSLSVRKETTWLSSKNDQTQYLDARQLPIIADYCLVWKSKDEGCRIPLQGKSLVIGRSAEAAQHVDETMGISRAHVELLQEAAQWKVKDLGSRNGTRLNDRPMTPYELYPLNAGDCLTLAHSQYRFQQAQ
ncbi:DUF6382 domain-containing protein [Cohnella lupini]|uniref:FHA domain-containing protein n=1 Tax=Cohnella lupini TaxID=1294267 RepID=A0A3D9HZG5_9BACL|nr:DUF6382 domain-containing protein [Cohnella lupini]RED54761.1 FHA domain-containing protein [Cohnella lupini]